jgi:hypothetical protein
MAVIRTYADLMSALASLPPPAPGRVRVFRGQNRDYPTMTPTGLRATPGATDFVWDVYVGLLARSIADVEGWHPGAIGDDWDLMVRWVHAIKQHYGPGSPYLDVTHSPGVAAWFALHRAESHREQKVYGDPGPYNPLKDRIGIHELMSFTPIADQPGYLYAFDVVPCDGIPSEHGVLVDLARAPSLFSSSPRIWVQQACLIFADRSTAEGNLASFIVSQTPLQIAWPLEGCPELERPTDQIFPPVTQDSWYARLVAVPLAPSLQHSERTAVYEHPIKLGLYAMENSPGQLDQMRLNELSKRFVSFRRPLLYPALLETTDETLTQEERSVLADATPILMEGPFVYVMAPIDSETFNVGLLADDLAARAPARDIVDESQLGSVTLDNVFIELSSLETAGWDSLERPDVQRQVVRALWVLRAGDNSFFAMFIDNYPSGSYRLSARISYEREKKRFVTAGKGGPVPLLGERLLATYFLKSCALLRTVSPLWKVGHEAEIEIGDADGITSLVSIEWALGELYSLRRLAAPLNHYFVLRQPGGNEVFFGGAPLNSPAIGGQLRITGDPLSLWDPDALRAAAASQISALPPPRFAAETSRGS